jgi:hypothetical protein
MHGEFLRLLFLQAHRETEAHFTAAGMSSQTNNSEALLFKRAAFYNGQSSPLTLDDDAMGNDRHGKQDKTAFIATVKRLVPRSFARFSFRV